MLPAMLQYKSSSSLKIRDMQDSVLEGVMNIRLIQDWPYGKLHSNRSPCAVRASQLTVL